MRSVIFWLSLVAATIWACGAPHPGPDLPADIPLLERPWRHDPDKFSFVVLGDKTGGGWENWSVLDRAIEEVNRLRPDFAIMVGDLIQGYSDTATSVADQWAEFYSHVRPLQIPFFYLPGNHDVRFPAGRVWWDENIGRTYYDFTYKGCHFLVLNTTESSDGGAGFGQEQITFAVDALRAHTDARHTFVFMHIPLWGQSNEWKLIEQALGSRRATVFAGHRHRLQHELQGGHRYVIHGPTGGACGTSAIKQLGIFPHYTHVTVEDDSVYVSVHEPGYAWPVDIAPAGLTQRIADSFSITSQEVRELGDGQIAVDVKLQLTNILWDSAAFVTKLILQGDWRANVDSVIANPPPEGTQEQTLTLFAPSHSRLPLPHILRSVYLHGTPIFTSPQTPVNPFPASVTRTVPQWEVIGPIDIGPLLTRYLPDNPREAMPRLFERRSPDRGWHAEATYDMDDTTYSWQAASADSTGRLNFDDIFGIREHALGYATCAVYSPTARRVAVRIRPDNFMQLSINGRLIAEQYTSPRDMLYIPVDLHAGWNTLMVKLVNNKGNWYFDFHLFDATGDLRFAAHSEHTTE